MSGDGSATYTLRATDDTAAAFNSVNKRIDSTSAQMAKIGDAMARAATVSAAAFATVASGMALIAQRTAAAVDSQNELATALHTSYNSLTNLGLIGKIVGVDMATMNQSVTKLNDSIADLARGGTGDAAKKLRELGFSADQLSGLDADQRIATIAERIKDIVPASQQAAYAVDILGKTAGQALLQIDSKMIEDAATQAERFGVALSGYETTQIAQIADSMDTINLAMDGIGNSVALSMAPIFAETAKQITGAADSMEGFRNVGLAVRAVLVNIVALVADVADVITLPFRAAGYTIEAVFANVFEVITKAYTNIIHSINAIPGVNLDEHERAAGQLAKSAAIAADSAENRIAELFTSKLWGNQLRDWVDDVDNASWNAARIASENAQKARAGMGGAADGGGVSTKGTEKQQELADLSAHLDERNRVIREHLWMSAEDEGELNQLRIRDSAVYAEQSIANERAAEDRKKQIRQAAIDGSRKALGDLSTLMNSHSRKAFETGKAAAIAGAIVDGIAATIGSFKAGAKIGGPVVGAAFAAASAAAMAVQIQNIKSQQFNGGGGSISSPSVTGAINEASTPVQSAPSLPMSSQSGGPSRNVTLIVQSDSGMVSMDWVRNQLAPVVNEAIGDGVKFMVA